MAGLARVLFSVLVLAGGAVARTDTVRVVTYNLLNYNGDPARSDYFRTILDALDPDIILVQEVISAAAVDSFLTRVLDERYATIPFHDGPDSDNHIFFNVQAVECLADTFLTTDFRDINEYTVRMLATDDTLWCYALHLRANEGAANEQSRLQEATVLRARTNEHHAGTRFLAAGDGNLSSSDEPAYQKLTGSEADNDGRFFDPVDHPAHWHDDPGSAPYHTESPRLAVFGGGNGGGLDDRFDVIFISQALQDRVAPGSYTAVGNDGRHFNLAVNQGTNDSVAAGLADALYYASDHLPVRCDLVFPGARWDRDARALTIILPDTVIAGTSHVPEADVENAGRTTAAFDVICDIGEVDNVQPYVDTAHVSDLTPGDTVRVGFAPWLAPGVGTFLARVRTLLADDQDPANDLATRMVRVLSAGVTERGPVADCPVLEVRPASPPGTFLVRSNRPCLVIDATGRVVARLAAGGATRFAPAAAGIYFILPEGSGPTRRVVSYLHPGQHPVP